LADGDFDDVVRRAAPDRWLASRLIADPRARADVVALYAFDTELARAISVTSSPLMAQIRLTWWVEAIEEMMGGGPVRAHPLAGTLADVVRRRGLPQRLLDDMIEGRIEALGSSNLDETAALRWADTVSGSEAVLAAMILGAKDASAQARPAGRAMGLARLVRRGLVQGGVVAPAIEGALVEADRAARILPARAFPAIAAASLARQGLAGSPASELQRRLRLLWASARGRL
jgi:phytoene synthase